MGGSGGGGTTTQIQKSDPWSGQQPYLTDVFNQAQQQYYGSTPSYYPGQTVASQDPSTQYAQNFASQQAGPGGALPAISNAAGQAAVFNLTDAKDVNSNPYLQGAIEAAIRPSIQAFTDPGGTLSQARTQFNNAGQFGSSRHGLAEGVLGGRLADNIFGTANSMASAGYTSGLNASLQQQALLPQTQQGILAPSTTAEAVGQQKEGYAQQLIDAAIQEWNFNQNLPSQKLAQYQNLIQGNYGGEGITTATGASGSSNKTMGVLGGAASGAAMGSAAGPYGTAIGAIIGGIMGAMGS